MFGGTDWRQAPQTAELMFQTFPIVRQLNQLLWFITEALDRCSPGAEYTELLGLLDETERLAATPADEMSWGDVDHHCLAGETVLHQVSAAIRAAALSAEPEQRPGGPRDVPKSLDRPVAVTIRDAPICTASIYGERTSGARICAVPTSSVRCCPGPT